MIQIRSGQPADAAEITRFQIEMAWETEQKRLDPDTVGNAVAAVFADPGKGFYLVAEQEGVVCASLMVTYEWSDWRNSNLWYIQSVFVRPETRGQGVFRALYDDVYQRAVQAGARFIRLYVETDNHRAQQVYEALGMKRMSYVMYDVDVRRSE